MDQKRLRETKNQNWYQRYLAQYQISMIPLNDAMSIGLHRLWKEKMCSVSKLQDNETVLDIATGTGDIALKLLNKKAVKDNLFR